VKRFALARSIATTQCSFSFWACV